MMRRSISRLAASTFTADLLHGRLSDTAFAQFFVGSGEAQPTEGATLLSTEEATRLREAAQKGSVVAELTDRSYVQNTIDLLHGDSRAVVEAAGPLSSLAYCSADAEADITEVASAGSSGSSANHFTVTGYSMALRSSHTPAKNYILFAEQEGQVKAFLVKGGTVAKSTGSSCIHKVVFNKAPATMIMGSTPSLDGITLADTVTARVRLQTAAAVAGSTAAVLDVCARYTQDIERFELPLHQSPVVQSRLGIIAGNEFALNGLTEFFGAQALGPTPEGDVVRIFAAHAASQALQMAEGIVGYRARFSPVGPKSPLNGTSVDLTPIQTLSKDLEYYLHGDASLKDLKSNLFLKFPPRVAAGTALRGHLVNMHVNLTNSSAGVESDAALLTTLLGKQKDGQLDTKKEVLVNGIADVTAELLASVVAGYKCTAAIDSPEGGSAESLLTNYFCEQSQVRRRRTLAQLSGTKKAAKDLTKVFVTSAEEEYSTHPVNLNPPKPKKAAASE